jgi:ankyrin repeat protein
MIRSVGCVGRGIALSLAIGAGLASGASAAGSAGSNDAKLAEAARQGDREAVALLLRGRVDVNAPSVDGTTALHWAVYRNDIEMANRLIRAGAAVNATNRDGLPPLALACTNGEPAMIELLLENGADAAAAPAGEPVLMTASRTGNAGVVALLLARGADINVKDGLRGQTPLMWASAENHPAVVRLLLEKGADVQARSTAGFTPLLFAAREGHLDVHASLFAYFLDKLRSTADSEGNLLDHSLILYGGCISDGNLHSHSPLPMLLAGGAAGQLTGGGIFATQPTRHWRTCWCRCWRRWRSKPPESATAAARSRISDRAAAAARPCCRDGR